MKRITLLFAACLLSAALFAQQSFYGVLTYKISLTGENAQLASSMMPDSYEYYIGKDVILFKMNGGMVAGMLGDVLMTSDGKTYVINHTNKTYSLLKLPEPKDKSEVTVEKQDEMLTILGMPAQKYRVEMTVNGETVTQYSWISDKYKIDFTPSSLGGMTGGSLFVKDIKGIPLKSSVEVMGMNVVMDISNLEEKKVSKSMFKLPKDYKETELDLSKMMGAH